MQHHCAKSWRVPLKKLLIQVAYQYILVGFHLVWRVKSMFLLEQINCYSLSSVPDRHHLFIPIGAHYGIPPLAVVLLVTPCN